MCRHNPCAQPQAGARHVSRVFFVKSPTYGISFPTMAGRVVLEDDSETGDDVEDEAEEEAEDEPEVTRPRHNT